MVIFRDGKMIGKIEIRSTTILTSIAVYQKEFPKPSAPFKRGDKVMKSAKPKAGGGLIPVKSEPKVGKILNVDPRAGSVILNRGSEHGFKIGDKFNVFRNNKLIGRIEVTRLSGTNTGLSVAQRSKGLGVPAGAQFQVNDDLVKLK